MLFNSYVFMLAFLPVTLIVYFLLGKLPERFQFNKLFLVLASFVFYGYNIHAVVSASWRDFRR